MGVSGPLPQNLATECRQAAKLFTSFSPSIPPPILQRAKGFALLSVAKAGFILSARAGSGIVIARLDGDQGGWSAPSAIGTAGGGVGFQVGVEVAEFLIVLK